MHDYLHHWLSHGMPSLSPSIFVPGQFFRKNVASAHEDICEQWMRPSHLKAEPDGGEGLAKGAGGAGLAGLENVDSGMGALAVRC